MTSFLTGHLFDAKLTVVFQMGRFFSARARNLVERGHVVNVHLLPKLQKFREGLLCSASTRDLLMKLLFGYFLIRKLRTCPAMLNAPAPIRMLKLSSFGPAAAVERPKGPSLVQFYSTRRDMGSIPGAAV